jgi:GNAT superfamily N-acetyltransferase
MITIRRAKQEDKESIWRVHIRAIKEICKSHYSEDELQAWSGVLKPWRYKEAIRSKTFFVAVDDDNIVGFGQLDQENSRIEGLYVRPDYAKRGVGMKILLTLEGVAKKSSLLIHLKSTLNAITFYENAGYTSTRQSQDLLPGGMVACIHMVKRLTL